MNSTPPPRLSVVIPVYNVEQYLPETIDSITTQDFDDFEAIFVDDASPDSCPALLDSAQEKYPNKIRIIHLKENRGTHFARKCGVLAARGDFLTFLDGDDYFLPNAFSTMIAAMQKNPADILRFNIRFEKAEDKNYSDDYLQSYWNVDFPPIFESPNILKYFVLDYVATGKPAFSQIVGALYPTRLVQESFEQTSEQRIVVSEDFYELLALSHFAKSLKKCAQPVYCYRLGSGISFKKISPSKIHAQLISAKNMQKAFEEFPLHPLVANFVREHHQNFLRHNAQLWLAYWDIKLPTSRAEKVGNLVLFPWRKLRFIVSRIEANPLGKILMKPARFAWNIFYKTAQATYRFLRKRKNPR